MEDVKKIARKFVSDSLAEKIAEFVAKATDKIVGNVSEENNLNVDDIQNISNDDKLQSIGRQRHETSTNDDQNNVAEYEKASTVPSERTPQPSNTGQIINWEKEVNEIANNKYSKETDDPKLYFDQPKIDEQPKTDEQSKSDNEPQKVEYEHLTHENHLQKTVNMELKSDKKHNIMKPKLRKPKTRLENQQIHVKERELLDTNVNNQYTHRPTLSTFRPTIDSTMLYQNVLRNGPAPVRPGYRLTGFDSQENPSATIAKKSSLRGFNIGSLTTEKERVEFDQYDNPNNPKSDFIATSGPVALPKVPMMKPWWEKEMV